MIVVFCSDPFDPRRPDDAYADEAATVERLGIARALIDYEALVHEGDAARAVRRVTPRDGPALALFRGWMLTPARYAALHEALASRGLALINSPDAYRHAHHFPASYPVIAGRTPASVWTPYGPDTSIGDIMTLLRPFGDRPLVLKDYVKSRKHEWAEACYIPSAADRAAVERVVRRFVALQGDDLNEGLVFREYAPLEPLGAHPRSGMPLSREYRAFYLDGRPVYRTAYWEGDATDDDNPPPTDLFADTARAVRSRFFTMDVARRLDGDWTIVELGDGGVAGLPDGADPRRFYEALRDRWPVA